MATERGGDEPVHFQITASRPVIVDFAIHAVDDVDRWGRDFSDVVEISNPKTE